MSDMNWQEAVEASVADDLNRHLVAMRPVGKEMRDSEFGKKEVTISEVWIMDGGDDGSEVKLYGLDVPIRWQVVQKQLARASEEAPWIVGTIEQKGRAYVLTPPSPRDRAIISPAMAVISNLRETGEIEPEYVGDDDGYAGTHDE